MLEKSKVFIEKKKGFSGRYNPNLIKNLKSEIDPEILLGMLDDIIHNYTLYILTDNSYEAGGDSDKSLHIRYLKFIQKNLCE